MSRRLYITASRLTSVLAELTPDDRRIVDAVSTVRLARTTQLQRLLGVEGQSSVRAFRRRLNQLTELGVLARLERRVGGRKSGSSSYVYGLGLAGHRIANPDARARTPWTPRASWLGHALLVSELYVRLVEAKRLGRCALLGFAAEPRCWRTFSDGYVQAVLKPDSFVRLGIGDIEAHYFVEIDRGTESPNTLASKFAVYRRYWLTGQEQARHGVFPSVLWVVPDDQRKGVVVDVAGRQPPDSWELHAVTTFEDAIALMTRPP